jgi:hypothetical protein
MRRPASCSALGLYINDTKVVEGWVDETVPGHCPADELPARGCGASAMDSTFGVLDAIAFLVFAVLIAVLIVIIVFLGQLPRRIARQRAHPQAAAINVAGWLGVATLGLLWPLALVWAFVTSSRS